MKKTDRKLGMGAAITRRDFVHGSGLLAMGLPLAGLTADGKASPPDAPYPPTLTGMRGSHPGSFETAHALAREGRSFPAPRDLPETYDLVVVGAGISGLAAAHFYRQRFGAGARILLLDNHDDFGGHARRNEFHQGGQMRLSLGGTHNLEHWEFSDTVRRLLGELGVDIPTLLKQKEFDYGNSAPNGPALWFDRQTYGENRLVTRCEVDYHGPGGMPGSIDALPISSVAREELRRFYTRRENVLEGFDEEAASAYLSGTAYVDFLREHGGLGPEALQLFDNANHGAWGLETRTLSVAEALDSEMPGLHLLGQDKPNEGWDYPAAYFPDGNASIARLLVHGLIPDVAPGTSADNIALARFDYSRLDQASSRVRLRLNATVIEARNDKGGVAITYVADGEPRRIRAGHTVMACYHSILPHLCPELPAPQKQAQKYQVKIPLILTNVLVRSSEPMDKLGIGSVRCPGRMHASVFMWRGVNTGGYSHRASDQGPVPIVFWGTLSPPPDVVDLREQLRASRARMLALSFEDYEREVRTVLDGMLGPAGMDVSRDVLAITVNRWPHGYAYEYMDLWDPDWPDGEAPHEIARRRHGNITMANSDAAASAYTHSAIDEAFRAVSELPRG